MKIRTEQNNQKILYPLAKAWVRFVAHLFDTVIIIGILIGCYFLLNLDKELSIGERFLILASIGFFVMFVYYIVVAFFTKGYTLLRWVFKIKLIEVINRQKYFGHLIIHDLFIWIHFSSLTLIYAIVTAAQPVNGQQEFINALFTTQQTNNPVAIVFKVLYSLCALVSLSFLIYSFVNSGKRSIPDLMSWTAMINLSKPTPQNKNKNVAPAQWTVETLHMPGNMDLSKESN